MVATRGLLHLRSSSSCSRKEPTITEGCSNSTVSEGTILAVDPLRTAMPVIAGSVEPLASAFAELLRIAIR